MINYIILGLSTSPVTVKFTAIGGRIQLTCPNKKTTSWQKIDSGDILASCESGKADINPIIFNKMFITDDCQNMTIKHFEKEDVGLYRCYINPHEADADMYDFDIQIRCKL